MSTSDDSLFKSANDSVDSSADNSFCSVTGTLGDVLKEHFSAQSNHLINVCHLNAQSVPSHFSDLYEAFSDTNVHAILISESWLKPHLLSTMYPLPGFVLIRNDRIDRRGGGVAIYLRSNFPYKLIASSCPQYNASAEYVFLEVWVRGTKLVLGVVYCPPSVDYFTDLDTVLESVGSEYTHHIIMGDLNTDLLSHCSARTLKLKHIIESASLHILPMQATHHNLNGEDTWLDLIFTSNPPCIHSHGQFPAPGFSHHDLIFLSYFLKPLKSRPKVLHLRSYARMDVEKLRLDASKLNWTDVTSAKTINVKICLFNEAVVALYDNHAPVRRIKLKRPPAPWMSRDIKAAMKRRDSAFHRYKKDRTDINWKHFKTARNRCNQVIRNAKRRHIHDNILSLSSSPANTWKFLRTIGVGGSSHSDLPGMIDLNDINRHFCTSIGIDVQTKQLTMDYVSNLPRPNVKSFEFSPVAPDEIKKTILSIKSKAVGCDEISRKMIITIVEQLLPVLTHIVNFSLESAQFPHLWCKAYIRPIPKISNPTLPAHFRPISILPFLSKVLEACVHKQLSRFVHDNNILSPLQSGFRPGHSTTTALLKVTGDVRAAMEDSEITFFVLVDFSNAFNNVSHDILLSILAHLMVSPRALEWFSSYLRGRQQSVRLDETSSSWRNLDAGVPQGGILSPLLFSLFINLITYKLHSAYHLYADDLQIYTQTRVENAKSAIDVINRDLYAIKLWSDRFGLVVNPIKCQAIVIGSPRMMGRLDLRSLPPIIFNGNVIALSSHVKNLGLLLDTTLNWRSQVASVSRKVTNTLRLLYRLKNFLPSNVKTLLVQTLIFPVIDYGDVCYLDLNADLLNKLDRLLNNCIRFVFNLRKYDHISPYRTRLHWLPIRQRRQLRALCVLFSLLHSPKAPAYLTPHFKFLCDSHQKSLRSSNNLLLLCPSHSSSIVHSSFYVQPILLWNSLPLEIRMSTTKETFKVKIKRMYMEALSESS